MMMLDDENDFGHDDHDDTVITEATKKTKPHVIRRNIEDYLDKKALQRRLQDVFDDDFLLD